MRQHRWRHRLQLCLFCALTTPAWGQDPPGVQLAAVETSEIVEEVRLTGTVNALRSSRLSTAVAGLVNKVAVETGGKVTQGDLLIGLDDEQATFELAGARAETEEARARLEEARRRLDEARSLGRGNIAATEVSTRETDVAAAQAALARLQAAEAHREVVLRRHRVEAPFDGVVSERSSELGEWVTPGDALLMLVDTDHLRLDFQVPQEAYRRIGEDSELLIGGAGPEGDSMAAEIDALVPVGESQSRTFLLRAIAPEGFAALPGMAVEAVLRISTGKQGLTVSRDAINRYPDGRVTVWIAEPTDGGLYAVREKRVATGTGFRDRVVVVEGLEGHEQVVVRGNESLEHGMTVRIAERTAR
ncbi:efflux RND transporter periplasmic adaptor subunit [Thiocapsa bogorovii]|uniref:efflux RND transporter periplasmic adaptor subunit n=1 Tax=Thiocapsa bogorovii TaxID=521689 RepID=UPI001E5124BF|nr:efflux RND transporter periplasmic adaptor subunit [Thiocapsa bogorovii]UHD17847.1 efflux RND transporter periplasmic adaptor subunit [Thiocapsa bogorovii]